MRTLALLTCLVATAAVACSREPPTTEPPKDTTEVVTSAVAQTQLRREGAIILQSLAGLYPHSSRWTISVAATSPRQCTRKPESRPTSMSSISLRPTTDSTV